MGYVGVFLINKGLKDIVGHCKIMLYIFPQLPQLSVLLNKMATLWKELANHLAVLSTMSNVNILTTQATLWMHSKASNALLLSFLSTLLPLPHV